MFRKIYRQTKKIIFIIGDDDHTKLLGNITREDIDKLINALEDIYS